MAMFFDAYTKLVLTVIAVSLTVISFRMSIPSASALGSCGWDVLHACHVTRNPNVKSDPVHIGRH
jgi:uncharacterized membrane protein YczE